MSRHSVLNSPRLSELKRRRRKVFQSKILLYLLAFSIAFACLAYISRIDKLKISGVEISGNKVVEAEMIKTAVEQAVLGNYLFVFPKDNILYYSKNTITDNLQGKFKRIKDINLSIEDEGKLKISVTEREALYTWCEPERTE